MSRWRTGAAGSIFFLIAALGYLVGGVGANTTMSIHFNQPGAVNPSGATGIGVGTNPSVTTSGGGSWPSTPSAINADICGNATYLQSPYTYAGATDASPVSASTWAARISGGASLPPLANYPGTTQAQVVSTSTASNSDIAANTLYYFEPGNYTGLTGQSPGANTAYVGGYSSGGVTINGGGGGVNGAGAGQVFRGQATGVAIEYMTITHYDSVAHGTEVVNQDQAANWTITHDTIGPNAPVQQSPTNVLYLYGYGLGLGSNDTIDYDCITQNGEGGLNMDATKSMTLAATDTAQGGSAGVVGTVIEHDEISSNGLAEYPDPIGTVAGLKCFFCENLIIDYDWVHNNYGVGLWPDTDNAGFDISHDLISYNWGRGVMYEVSSNANITDDNFLGNLTALNGAWPTCTGNGQAPCQYGNPGNGSGGGGPGGFTFTALYLSGSGGSSTPSNYSTQMTVTNDNFQDNFGGIYAHMSEDQWCGSVGFATGTNFGSNALFGGNTAEGCPTYNYSTYKSDGPIYSGTNGGGTTVANVVGTTITLTSSAWHGYPPGGEVAITPPNGLVAYGTGIPNGDTVSGCTTTTCTLATSATTETGIEVDLGKSTGCSPANLAGTTWGNAYYDNCDWWVNNLNVSNDTFSTNATAITATGYTCDSTNGCGYNALTASTGSQPGTAFDPYETSASTIICNTAKTDNVFANNTYAWTGTGGWLFYNGDQGVQFTQSQWTTGYNGCTAQDAGSTGL